MHRGQSGDRAGSTHTTVLSLGDVTKEQRRYAGDDIRMTIIAACPSKAIFYSAAARFARALDLCGATLATAFVTLSTLACSCSPLISQ